MSVTLKLPLPVLHAGVAASFAAALTATAGWCAVNPDFGLVTFIALLVVATWPAAFVLAMLAGPPIFGPLIESGKLRWWSAGPAGVLVALGPVAGMMVISALLDLWAGRPVDPSNLIEPFALLAASGLAGGLAFWALARGGEGGQTR